MGPVVAFSEKFRGMYPRFGVWYRGLSSHGSHLPRTCLSQPRQTAIRHVEHRVLC